MKPRLALRRGALIVLLSLSLLLLWQSPSAAASRTVRVGVFPAAPLVQNTPNKPEGLFIDLIEYFASSLDWNVEYVDKPWGELLVDLENGDIDLLPAVAVRDERREIYDYSQNPPFVDSGVLFTGPSFNLVTILDLQGARVAGVEGSIFTRAFESYAASFGVVCDIVLEQDNPSVMQAIADGTADAGICIYSLGIELAKEYPVSITAISFAPTALSFAVPKGKNSDLIAGIDQLMAPMMTDPNSLYSRSFEKWIMPNPPASIPVWIWWGIGGLLLLGLFSAFWAILLRRQVSAKTKHLVAEISERNRAEGALLAVSRRLELALHSARAGTWDWDVLTGQIEWSPAMFDLFGLDPATTVASFESWRGALHPEDSEVAEGRIGEALALRTTLNSDYRVVLPGGQTRWINAVGEGVYDPQGHPVQMIGICWDITERKQAEEALRTSEANMRFIIKHDPSAIAVYDRDLRYIAVSDRFLKDYEILDEDIVGKHHYEVFPEIPQKWRDVHQRVMCGAIESEKDDTFVRLDGSLTYNSWECRPWYDSDGSIGGIITYTEVTTDRKLAEDALRERDEQLRQSQKMEAVGQLAGGIAHDFNNLLTVIIGYGDLLLAREGISDSPAAEDVKQIERAAERASALTRQILAFSRRQALRPSVVSLNEILVGIEPLLRRTLGENIKLASLQHPGLGHAEVDVHQFEQVLMNLALNARDAMPAGGRLTFETANVELDEDYCRTHPEVAPGSYVMLSVSDTGIGMDEAILQHVFEPFFTTKAPGQGTGLGLAMVYGTVKQSKGNIFVYSEPGKGTTFRIYLPLIAEREGAKVVVVPDETPHFGNERVMVVEDESSLRSLIERVLGEAGYEVRCFGSADEAMVILEQDHVDVDLLLTDVVLPGAMQGNDLARRVRISRPDLPVLYMSGYTRDAIVHAGRLDEGVNLLEKPFTTEALARKVRSVLDERRGSGQG